ncbi:heterokaryon incompatibility Het-C [Trichodelitschia bisporula]|uniref:Heterokaryon incompatibility Het-C n=1 Tax=Trichodelitschia bisporula TaxID=703511 RepID=A0A6G1HZM5_9PEZI|nr:heterokaryon incompatibility Het-C [Trichodelitschia bisporula]
MASWRFSFLLLLVVLVVLPSHVSAFGAGNIASISKIEGKNWRHGDIEDLLATVAFLRGHKWTSKLIKRVYFGNWLRDYSQAVDVGTLKGVQADTIRVLVWVLSFMAFGYATEEYEVTSERLGVYRPEEHIDNPRDYADNEDARQYDPRLRPPVAQEELNIDPNTGMKNYIANENGFWATSSGYIKHSLNRSIHFGREYTSGQNRGQESDLNEALRCLGQALHTLEDFGAHTNYVELTLREMGFHNVFAHCGTASEVNIHGKRIYPLVTGTFGGVDFLHSVLGEVTDHVTQSELDEMNDALGAAATSNKKSVGGGPNSGPASLDGLTDLLSKIPGTGGLIQEAASLQAASDAQAASNSRGFDDYSGTRASGQPPSFQAPPGSVGGPPGPGIPGTNPNLDPQAVIARIYPILIFRDNVARAISAVVSKIPGLEKLIETISERVTLFVFSLLAPYIQPLLKAASQSLKTGSSAVVDASGKHQFEPWTDPHCTDPTHSLLSKDHFSNILNEPAGQVAASILQYVAPRVIYAWEHPDVPVQQVLDDVTRVFHHPALRDPHLEIHQKMFAAVEKWVQGRADRGNALNNQLSSESVKEGHNHTGEGHGPGGPGHSHGTPAHAPAQHGGGFSMPNIPGVGQLPQLPNFGAITGLGSHSKVSGSPFDMFTKKRELGEFDDGPGGGAPSQAWTPGPTPDAGYGYQQGGVGYEQQNFDPMAGQAPPPDVYGYQVGTSYQQGYSDGGPPPQGPGGYGGYEHQQPQHQPQHQPQQQHQQPYDPNRPPPGAYGQYGGGY